MAINGAPATRNRPLEEAAQAEQVRLGLVRGGKQLELDVPTQLLDLAFWPTSELRRGDDGAWSWLPS